MGNVLDTPCGIEDSSISDSDWLNVQNSTFFNESYLSDMYDQLPLFEGTEIAKKDQEENIQPKNLKLSRLAEIFCSREEGVASIEDFKGLSCVEEVENSTFVAENKRRSRLLQRIHLAYQRETFGSNSSSNDVKKENFLPTGDIKNNFEDADGLMTATSIRMSLAIMKCLGPTNPALFEAMSCAIMDLLVRSSELALSKIKSDSPQSESLRAIVEYAEQTANDGGRNRQQAIALMLAVALTTGSLHTCLAVVKLLESGNDMLPETAKPFLQRLEKMKSPLDLSVPSAASICGEVNIKSTFSMPQEDAPNFDASFCGDGLYLYLWNGVTRSLHKIGTGFHGTIAGNEYLANANIESQIIDRIPEDVDILEVAARSVPEATAAPVRSVRILSEVETIVLREGQDIAQVNNEDFEPSDESGEVLELHHEATILEEREVSDGGETPMTFYRIGERTWIPARLEAGESSDDDDDDEEEDEEEEGASTVVINFVEVFEREAQDTRTAASPNSSSKSAYQQAWVGCANGKIYLRMKYLLGPYRLAVFSSSTLKLEDIVEVDLPIPLLQKSKRIWDRRNDSESKDDDVVEEKQNDLEEEWEFSPESRVLTPQSAVVSASSNFLGSSSEAEANLIAPDETYNSETTFIFSAGDSNQEIIVDLGAMSYVSRVGIDFQPAEHENQLSDRFSAHVSAEGLEYVPFGTVTESAGLSTSPCYISFSNQTVGETSQPSERNLPYVRYIRLNFGAHSLSGGGSMLKRIFVEGSTKVKKEIQLPFPVLTSDGKHLLFVHFDGSDGCLRSYLLDPRVSLNVFQETTYICGTIDDESKLHKSSFAFNSETLILSHQKKFSSVQDLKEAEYSLWKMNSKTGEVTQYSETMFTKAKGYPSGLCYDSRNNMLWGFDCFSMRCLRWRNGGLAPRFEPPKPKVLKHLMLSTSPANRIEAMNAVRSEGFDSKAEAAYILCHLDRVATPYSPPSDAVAEAKCYDEIEIISAGFEDGCNSKILVRGQLYGTIARGFNILVLNDDFEVCDFRNFDTHESANDSDRMADFIYTIPDGRIVLIGTWDSASSNLSSRGSAALSSLGAEKIASLSVRGSFSMITRKGKRSAPIQKMLEKKKGPAVVRVRLPAPKIPLCIEISGSTISSLVEIVHQQYSLVRSVDSLDIHKVMLLSSMRLLTTNIFQLLRGSAISSATEVFGASDRKTIMTLVMEIIDSPPTCEGGEAIAESALKLLITSIDVLYPSTSDKCALLVQYLDQFVNETLSTLEMSVLELLLRQMSSSSSLALLFKQAGGEVSSGSSSTELLASLLSIAKKETIRRLDSLSARGTAMPTNSVGEAAVQMLASLCNMMLSEASQLIVVNTQSEETVPTNDSSGAIVALLNEITVSSVEIINYALLANARIQSESGVLDDEIDEVVKLSPVGVLMPTILNVTSILFDNHGSKMIQTNISSLCDSLTNCVAATKDILCKVPKDKLFLQSVESSVTRTSNQIYESDHPYASNTDKTWELKFPGAIKITIVFDEQSKTENNYDFVKFWKNSSKSEVWHEGIEKYCGRQGSENWPGCGGRAALVIEGDEAFVEFHSDGSNEDWGWRFTATVEYKRSMSSKQIYWLIELEKQLTYCGTTISSKLILSNPWNKEKEDMNAMWLEDSLLNFGFKDESELENDLSDEIVFLRDFIDRPDGSEASILCRKMKALVNEDQGQVEDINKAVYGTCAALIKHNNITHEALSFARNKRPNPPEQLLKIWIAGQKMRSFFAFGDVRNAASNDTNVMGDLDDLPPPTLLARGPSIYSGADADVVKQVSDGVVKRVKFLLRVNAPAVMSQATTSSAKKKWNLLSKVALNSGSSSASSDAGNKWQTLVGEVQSAYKLKGMLSFRRKAVERKDVGTKSVSEKVLRFVQSRVDITDLESLRSIRNKRAMVRATGFDMISKLVESACSPFSVTWLMSSLSLVLRSAEVNARARAHIHFLNGLEGCSHDERVEVTKSFFVFVEKCVSMLGYANAKYSQIDVDDNERKGWKDVAVGCLRALALDYDITDHGMLDQCNLVSELKLSLQSSDFNIQRTAWSLFEVLLPRCVGLEGQKVVLSDEPSQFSSKLVALLATELNLASEKVALKSTNQPTSPMVRSSQHLGKDIVSQVISLRRDCLGHSYPHFEIGLNHTFSLWIYRKRCAIEDTLQSGVLKEGSRVMQGPDWNSSNRDIKDDGVLGTVVKVEANGTRVNVKWDNKLTKSYRYGAVEDDVKKFDVVLIDENLGGHIYSKGMNGGISDEEKGIVWSSFGLNLRPDATIRMFAYAGSDNYAYVDSKTKVGADTWTHVAVVQERAVCQIYINGQLDVSSSLPSHMLYPGKGNQSAVILESPHPYLDNTDQYSVVEVPDAISYSITFDPQTKTESNYDFIRFYKDDSHSDYWGEEKYSGGRGGSSSNWPGLNGSEPLVIPASRFVVYFKSDGSNNDWGYLMTCVAQKPELVDESREVIQNLNCMPLYIGQVPLYADNMSPKVCSSMEGLLCSMSVFTKSLSADQISSLSGNAPSYVVDDDEEMLCLDVLSMMHRSFQALSGIETHVNNAFVGPHILNPLFFLAANGTAWVKQSALRLCSYLIGSYSIDMVNVQASRNELMKNNDFLQYLFDVIGGIFNVWSTYSTHDHQIAHLCNELEFSIGIQALKLLKSLAVSELWSTSVSTYLEHIANSLLPDLLLSLNKACADEISQGVSLTSVVVPHANINSLYALLALCGASLNGMYTGASCKYSVGEDNGMKENCVIIAPTWPPREEVISKEELPLWKDLKSFGDAFAISLSSQPGEYLIVPRSKLVVSSENGDNGNKSAEQFFSKHASLLSKVFTAIASIDGIDRRPTHVPIVKEFEDIREFESNHPYEESSDKYTDVSFPGATKIYIEFNSSSRTKFNTDYVKFYKDKTHTSYWGAEKYSGKDNEKNWPGLDNRQALVIPADSFVVYFHSDSSNSEWGYKFTARARCVLTTNPPARPPLLNVSLSSHIKLMGMNAFNSMLADHPWFTSYAVPLVLPLIDSALSQLPVVKEAISRKPVILESGHPYDHNKDDYIPVRVRGAKKLVITFSAETATENGCDYVRLYKDESKTEYWGENQYTGGKDGGNSNWPGISGRPPLIISADSFILYFHSDGSVNAWGWKMFVTCEGGNGGVDTSTLTSLECLYRAQCYQQVICEGPSKQAEPEGLEKFDSKPISVQPAVDLVTDIDVELKFNESLTSDGNILSRPTLYGINIKEIGEIQVRESPDKTSPVLFTATGDTKFVLIEERQEWLLVTTSPEEKKGWVLRRSNDSIYLIPVKGGATSAGEGGGGLITIEDELTSSSSGGRRRHPMYDVDETSISQASGLKESQLSIVEIVKAKDESIEKSLYNISRIGCIRLAEDCITSIIAKWPSDQPFSINVFGNSQQLIMYLKSIFNKERAVGNVDTSGIESQSSSLGYLKTRILDAVRSGENDELCDTLIKFAMRQLVDCLNSDTALPPTKALVKTLECKHPYDDNMDVSWDLSIPGAKWLKIVFDKRSSTEKDCDYCIIYRDHSKSETVGTRYTGRESGSDKVWAGVGSVPACIVPSDSCVVHFHSDGSNTDWGFALTCYGIMEEPTEEQKDHFLSKKESKNGPAPDLACWILQFLAKETVPSIQKLLYSANSIKILRKYVEVMPDEKKCFAVNLLTILLQEIKSIRLSESAIDEIKLLNKCIINLAKRKQKEEFAASGGNVNEISQLLQSLTQAAVILDTSNFDTFTPNSADESKEDEVSSVANGKSFRWSQQGKPSNLEITGDGKDVTCSNSSELPTSSIISTVEALDATRNEFSVRLTQVSNSAIAVGVMTSGGFLALGNQEISLPGESNRSYPFSPLFVQDDVISVVFDSSRKVLSYYRNGAWFGDVVGPENSGADVIYDVGNDPIYPAVSLCKNPAVSLCKENDQVSLDGRPLSLIPQSVESDISRGDVPEWYLAVKRAVTLLKSCATRELPLSILSREFLSSCELKAAVTIESSHPFAGSSECADICIPGADELNVRFDPLTCLDSKDIIRLTYESHKQVEFVGMKSGCNLEANNLAVGDKVVRGSSWTWGNEDGSAGSYGFVTDIVVWKGKSRCGAKVKWSNGYEGLYRWGYEGMFDLVVVSQSITGERPIKIQGNSLKLEVLPGSTSLNRSSSEGVSDQEWKGALHFDGTGQVEIQSRPSIELNGDCTVEAWVKIDAAVSPSSTTLPIVSRVICIDSNMYQFSLQLGCGELDISTPVLQVLNMGMSLGVKLHGGHVKVGEWTHICAVIQGQVSTLLVNGHVVNTANSMSGEGRMNSLDAPLLVGGGDGVFFHGYMFDVRVWNCARGQESIRHEKNTGPRSDLSNLVCHIATVEPQDNILMDAVSENPPAIISGGVTWSSTVERHVMPVGSFFGYKCTITPKFSLDYVLRSEIFASDLALLRAQYTVGETRHDIALVRYINHVATTKNMDLASLLRCQWNDIAPSPEILVTMPTLKELVEMTPFMQIGPLSTEIVQPTIHEVEPGLNKAGVKMCTGTASGRLVFYCGRNLGRAAIPGSDGRCGPNNGPQCADCSACAPQHAFGESFTSRAHHHPLVLTDNLNNHTCDVCRTSANNHVYWRCSDRCDFDECMVCALIERGTEPSDEKSTTSANATSLSVKPVEARYKLLQNLNKALMSTISYVDLCLVDKTWSIANLLASCRGLIFETTKRPIWNAAMSATNQSSSGQFELRLSRPRAARHMRTGVPDHDARFMVFSQAFRQMHTMPPASLRRSDKLYTTYLMGERAHDAGGPYRESFAMYAMELQSGSLPLMVRVPNEKQSVGQNREKWILNPGATSSLHMEMFCFMGKLLGIAVRTKEYLALNIPSIIWKLLVDDVPTREDLEGIDLFQVQSLDRMRHIESEGITADTFNVIFYETFTVVSSDERVVELFPGGAKIDVTFDNRKQFCDLVENFRLHEFDKQAAAVRRGLSAMIPSTLLSLYTWDQLEMMVCGLPTIDVQLLKSITEYSSCSATDSHVVFFWQALEEFNHEERSNFVRFTWGRSRLPLTADGFSQRLKLQSFNKSPADSYLPVSHTCFFSLELPRYSTLEIMKDKLRYAIFNCQAIDGDDTSVGMTAAGMGWEE